MSGRTAKVSTRRGRRSAVVLLAALIGALCAASVAAADGTFGKPFVLAAPVAADLLPVQLAFAPDDGVAAAFGITDEDDGADSSGRLALTNNKGVFGAPRTVAGASQILAVAYRGPTLQILFGTSPAKQACCTAVFAAQQAGGALGSHHALVRGLTGATDAVLVPDQGTSLAAVATEHGVWAAQSNLHGRFGPARSLNVQNGWPQQLTATVLGNGHTFVAWTARTSQFAPGPVGIYSAGGSVSSAPAHPRLTREVPATHTIDELAVAARGTVPTIAWIESWYDGAGAFHSQAYAEDLGANRTPMGLSSPNQLASGLVLASGADGSQIVAFRACTSAGACVAQASLRRGGRFGLAGTLGAIDPIPAPAVAVSPTGAALVAWIQDGGVRAAAAADKATRLGSATTVSVTSFASSLTAAFAPLGDQALIAWTQGTLNQSVVAASFRLAGPAKGSSFVRPLPGPG